MDLRARLRPAALDRWALVCLRPSACDRSTSINFVAGGRDGRIWIAIHGGGLAYLEHARLHLVRAPDSDLTDFAALQDADGTMWFAAPNRLSRYKDGRLSAVTGQGLPTAVILALLDDSLGHLWFASSGSHFVIDKREIDRAFADSGYRMEVRRFEANADLGNGLPARIPRAATGPNQTLWLVESGGLFVVDLKRFPADVPGPPVRIETIDIDGKPLAPAQSLSMSPGVHNVQIGYTAMTLVSPKTVVFQYRLDGFDKTWLDAGTRREAFYTNLPPGQYHFLVRARNIEGRWSVHPAGWDFSIAPLFYQRAWFPPTIVALLGCGVSGLWQLRVRRMRREFTLIITERVRMSRAIHDTLLQSLVAVALKLQGVVDMAGMSTDAGQQLTRMRKEVEGYIREARRSIWNLRWSTLEREDLSTMLKQLVQRVIEHEPIALDFSVSGEPRPCTPEVEEQLLRIAQEAVVNTVHHAAARRIRLSLDYEANGLRLKIEDDGRGFSPSGIRHADGAHCGLSIMKERAHEIGGELLLAAREGAGTTIEVAVPLSAAA